MAYVVTNHRAFSSESTFSCHIDILKIFRELYMKKAKETLNSMQPEIISKIL
jgi:hypothetical protein